MMRYRSEYLFVFRERCLGGSRDAGYDSAEFNKESVQCMCYGLEDDIAGCARDRCMEEDVDSLSIFAIAAPDCGLVLGKN